MFLLVPISPQRLRTVCHAWFFGLWGCAGQPQADRAPQATTPPAMEQVGLPTLPLLSAELALPAIQAGSPVVLDLDVFAPFARAVTVAGTFNGWSPTSAALQRDPDGLWRGGVFARAGDEYRLVIEAHDGAILWRNDPRARAVTSSVGNSVVIDPSFAWTDDAFVLPSLATAVIYELHVGTFAAPQGVPGTLDDASARLDDLLDLGVNVIELMPVHEFAGDISWGYNPAHPFTVESAYGGLDALRRFVDAAHARGIAVILDVVDNHLGPSDLDLWRFDGWSQNDGGGAYFYNDDRARTPWGHTRPDYGRPEVRRYLRDHARFWLVDNHLDGLRFDSTGNIRARDNGQGTIGDGERLLREITDDAHALGMKKLLIAEDLQGAAFVTEDTDRGGLGFDAQWDAGFVHPVRAALTAIRDEDRDLDAVASAIHGASQGLRRVIYTESHDEVANGRARLPEDIWPGQADSFAAIRRSTLGALLVFTSPGIPMLFQGQEVLEDEWFRDTVAVDWSRQESFADVRALYRDLIHLRTNRAGTSRGLMGPHVHVFHNNQVGRVLAFSRHDQGGAGDDVVVVANFSRTDFSEYRVGFPRCGAWHVRRATDDAENHATVDATRAGADGLPCSGVMRLTPWAGLVLSQDP